MATATLVPVAEGLTSASRNPVAVYLASLSSRGAYTSQQVTLSRLTTIARLMTGNPAITAYDVPWQQLRFEHMAWLRQQLSARYGYRTANAMLSAVRGVCKAAWRLGLMRGEDYQLVASVENVSGESVPAGREITAGERSALMETCLADTTAHGRRDAALLALLYGCGLRRHEVAGLNIEDYDPTQQAFRLVGKRNKERLVYVSASGVEEALADWLAVRPDVTAGPLFVRFRRGGHPTCERVTPQGIREAVQARAKEASVAKLTPHDFRRTFIGDLLERGADIATVAKLAGHASVQTTAAYDRRPETAKRRAAALLHVPYRRPL